MKDWIPAAFSRCTASLLLGAGLLTTSPAALTFVGTNGLLSAAAEFDVVGGNLQITLNNTSWADVTAPTGGGGILTAVFFDLSPTTTLTPISAVLGLGSVVHFGLDGGGNVGGEWAFGSGLAGAPGNAGLGTSSSGFGLFGSGNFNGPDLDPPGAVNGLNYGLTTLGDDITTGNAAVTGNVPLIRNSVIFTLSGNPAFTLIGDYIISNVTFQYGTDLTEPAVPGLLLETSIPEPSALALTLCGVMALAVRRRTR